MKKNVYFPSVICLLTAIFSNSSIAQFNTIFLGYSRGMVDYYYNNANGFNVKYLYEPYMLKSMPLGFIGSLCYMEISQYPRARKFKFYHDRYHILATGISLRLNDWISIYNLIGIDYGKFSYIERLRTRESYHTAYISYGFGVNIHLLKEFSMDLSYEESHIDKKYMKWFGAGLGYSY